MRVIDSLADLEAFCAWGTFNLARWQAYARQVLPGLEQACLDDMRQMLHTGQVSFEEHYAPVLNQAIEQTQRRRQAHAVFKKVCQGLPEQIDRCFGCCPDLDIVFYLGLCNGAGWVTNIKGRTCILLGIEKILELGWDNAHDMRGLIYHETGHAHHMQFGHYQTPASGNEQRFLWQLFTEGIATYYAQTLAEDDRYYHQNKAGWLAWCEAHEEQIKQDFAADLPRMRFDTQRWFGDWVRYQGWGDVGYYLGARFVQFIGQALPFHRILQLTIDQVNQYFQAFLQAGASTAQRG